MQVYFNGMVFCFYLVGYLYTKLTLACVWDTMIRYRGVGKVRIISTPNRNRYLCYWNTLSRDHAAVLSKQCLSARACFIHMWALGLVSFGIFFDTAAKSILLKRYRCLNCAAHSTLALLQRFVGLELLELFKLSSCAFSQSGNYWSRVVPVMMLLTSVSEKQRTNISTDRSGMAPKWGTDICVLIRFGTYRFHRYRCRVGTGFRYPTL